MEVVFLDAALEEVETPTEILARLHLATEIEAVETVLEAEAVDTETKVTQATTQHLASASTEVEATATVEEEATAMAMEEDTGVEVVEPSLMTGEQKAVSQGMGDRMEETIGN